MEDKFYKCSVCGNTFGVIFDSGITPTCCNKPMEVIKPNVVDASVEKHIPVITISDNVCNVKVGEIIHPMLNEHYIDWILIKTNKGRHRFVLKPNDIPEVNLTLGKGERVIKVYADCNLHGLWQKEID